MPFVIALPPPAAILACALLLATVISLWSRLRWMWVAGLCLTMLAGYCAGVLSGLAALWCALLALSLWLYQHSTSVWARASSFLLCLVVTLMLATHLLPGFANPLLVRDVVLATGAAPYTLYFNFDKAMAGILLVGLGLRFAAGSSWSIALGRAVPVIAANVLLATVLSLALGYVNFEPRWTGFFWPWAVTNLLTCFSEEAFFRGFLQRELALRLAGRRGERYLPVIASALMFGVAHAAGGWRYVLLATVAGAGYAIVYQRTQRLEMSILAHFAVNAIHFLFFTYPHLV